MRPGFVYALWSDNCPFIKLGRTETSPAQRLAEINASGAYGAHGPWHLLACQKVSSVVAVETALHGRAGRRMDVGTGANELFDLSRAEALDLLGSIPLAELFEPLPIERLSLEPALMAYLFALFEQTGLEVFMDQQEAWTFSLFPPRLVAGPSR